MVRSAFLDRSAATAPGASLRPVPRSVPELDPWRPTATDPFSPHLAAHLFRRAGFGASPAEVQAAVNLGVDRTIDLLLAADNQPIPAGGWGSLPHGESLDLDNDVDSQRAQWLYECVHTPHPLKEKISLFWHDHFSVGTADFNSKHYSVEHINVFRRHGLGRFKDLLREVTKDPAMLVWLDNSSNGRPDRWGTPQINENYAREILELYTMGAGSGYSQSDIVEAAKCLSGWGLVDPYYDGRFIFRSTWHVPGAKWFLGRKIEHPNWGTEGMKDVEVLFDTILGHAATAKFLTKKIWNYFVSNELPTHVHDRLAQLFQQSGFDIKQLLSVIFRSKFFFGPKSRRKLIKNPVELAIGALRQTNKTVIHSYKELGRSVAAMGLPLLRYGNPAGTEDGLSWLTSQTMVERMNLVSRVTWKSPQYRLKTRFDPYSEVDRLGLRTAEAIVDHYLAVLVDFDVTPQVRAFCLEFMHRLDFKRELFTGSRYQIDQKVRGLVRAVMALPQYQVN